MNCEQIIKTHLKEKGFDGLSHAGLTCCCSFKDDNEFMPCGDPHIKACEAGHIDSWAGDELKIIPTKYLECPECTKPRPVSNSGAGFLKCKYCGDIVPF